MTRAPSRLQHGALSPGLCSRQAPTCGQGVRLGNRVWDTRGRYIYPPTWYHIVWAFIIETGRKDIVIIESGTKLRGIYGLHLLIRVFIHCEGNIKEVRVESVVHGR
jgi:hypothetical protein